MNFLQNLAHEGVLVCPACRGRLATEPYVCQNCRKEWPAAFGVPDFFNEYGIPAGQADVDKTAVDRIRSILALPTSSTHAVATILARSQTLRCGNSNLNAEIADMNDRFFGGTGSIAHPPIPDNVNSSIQAEMVRHYLPDKVTRGVEFSANVRLRNKGNTAWSSRTTPPAVVIADWVGGEGRATTSFPIDIAPGCSISIPLRLRAPVQPGRFILGISIGCGGSLTEIAKIDIDVSRNSPAPSYGLPPMIVEFGEQMDYAADHQDAVMMVLAHIAKTEERRLRILEVGCGTHPQLAWVESCDIVGLDISSPMLELGSLYFEGKFPHRFGLVCADALNPPFRTESFDIIAMFAALHHFPEPDTLLKKLVTLLRPGGFIAVMCEPIGDSLEMAPTVRDLLKGINEQVFSLDEYRLIFGRAGLSPVKVHVDGGSLKAILHGLRPVTIAETGGDDTPK